MPAWRCSQSGRGMGQVATDIPWCPTECWALLTSLSKTALPPWLDCCCNSLVPACPFDLHCVAEDGNPWVQLRQVGAVGTEAREGWDAAGHAARRPQGCRPEQPVPVSLSLTLSWSLKTSLYHSSVCMLSYWWALAGCPGMTMSATSPLLHHLNSEQTTSCLQSLVS